MKLSGRSEERLIGVNPALVSVVRRAAVLIDTMYPDLGFIVTEGLRTVERQQRLVETGASMTMKSRHLTGHAVDLAAVVDGDVLWDWSLYLKLADVMKQAAKDTNTPIRWGGTWGLLSEVDSPIQSSALHKDFPDGPHFELPAGVYTA